MVIIWPVILEWVGRVVGCKVVVERVVVVVELIVVEVCFVV